MLTVAKKCSKYSFALDNLLKLESETIREGNYHFCFFDVYKIATVVEWIESGKFRTVKQFSLNKLTHELAVQWVNKLKTYAIFQ